MTTETSHEHITTHPNFTVHGLPAYRDNYIWVIKQPVAPIWQRAAVITLIDPGQAEPVLRWLAQHQCAPDQILITHQHPDHIGGLAQLRRAYPHVPVYGPHNEPIADLTHRLAGPTTVPMPADLAPIQVIPVPGHTGGHLAYYLEDATAPALFCGDTLFASGCGRVFSALGGTVEALNASLSRLSALPGNTHIYCAHEYTLSNLAFACHLEPHAANLLAYRQAVENQRAEQRPTVPTTLAHELQMNPFLRCHEAALQTAVMGYAAPGAAAALACFKEMRSQKDQFQPPR
ncbi:hydroxyacylglutathione hydrolase [Parvibium lacunae]|uniref:Hydroxyacylglutathione hydrolase n=1 Tax=Parvibium lacunae TaxID=1888893 RepID=A0A368L6L6_9BURK|nr:hydroxyacylglutathione hydrolase [Parvibium lacunae]RCS59202.1 hydroxyacylglutathione hydrolase [Parvibium lacunae]